MNDFTLEDVKEILWSQTISAYTEKKGMVQYIKQLEEKIKKFEDDTKSPPDLSVVE